MTVRRHDLTEQHWRQLQPRLVRLVPPRPKTGRRNPDRRRILNGILWQLKPGAPWRDLPERYGPWKTCYERLVRWRRDGTWDRLLAHAQTKSDAVGEVVWEVSIDSTTVRAHQHAAGARKQPARADAKGGRSRRRMKRLGGAAAGSRPSST